MAINKYYSSYKIYKQFTLGVSCILLAAHPIQASMNLDDKIECFLDQKLFQPISDFSHDVSKDVKRLTRAEASSYTDQILEKVSDILEDTQDKIERSIKRPIEDWLRRHLG